MDDREKKILVLKNLDVSELDDDKVMIDFETDKYFLLRGSANEIWDLLQEGNSTNEIIEKLQEIYEVDEATCERSVLKFLDVLKGYKFIAYQE